MRNTPMRNCAEQLVLKENCYDRRTNTSFDRWHLYSVVAGTWPLRKPVLVPFHGFCWAESVSVWIHELVPDDDVNLESADRRSEHAQLALGSGISSRLRGLDTMASAKTRCPYLKEPRLRRVSAQDCSEGHTFRAGGLRAARRFLGSNDVESLAGQSSPNLPFIHFIGRSMLVPRCATPGMLTGKCPRIWISPKSALTALVSDTDAVENVHR